MGTHQATRAGLCGCTPQRWPCVDRLPTATSPQTIAQLRRLPGWVRTRRLPWPPSPCGSGTRCSTRTCAGGWPGWFVDAPTRVPAAVRLRGVSRCWPRRCCPSDGPPSPPAGARGGDGTRRAGLHRGQGPGAPACPVADGLRLAAGRITALRRADGTDSTVHGNRSAGARPVAGLLRSGDAPVEQARLDAVWGDRVQRDRALAGLIADGLVDARPDGRFALPGTEGSRYERRRRREGASQVRSTKERTERGVEV